jgi:golgin subfamily B member 1
MAPEIQKRAPTPPPAPPSDGVEFDSERAKLEKAGRWRELADLIEQHLLAYPGRGDFAALLVQAAQLHHQRLSNSARAEDCYRRALAVSPSNVLALEGLATLFAERGELIAQAGCLERVASQLTGPEAAKRFVAIGALYEKAGRPHRAALAYRRAVRADPENREALRLGRKSLLAVGHFQSAFDALETEREKFGVDGLAAEYAALAQRLIDQPVDHPLAQQAARTALELDPKDTEAQKAATALVDYAKNWKERARALRAEALEERDRRRAASLYLSIAQAHAVYDPDGTTGKQKVKEFLDRALLLWPGMPSALDFLERYAAQFNDYKTLEVLYERFAANIQDRTAAADVYLRLAQVRLVQFGDRAGALLALTRATTLDPSRGDAAGLAAEILLDDKRSAEAKDLLERHLETLSDPGEQAALRLTLADLLGSRLEDAAGARAQLEAVLRLDPLNQKAARSLLPLYERTEDWPKLATALEVAMHGIVDPEEKVSTLERAAQLYGERLSRPLDALRTLGLALLIEPSRIKLRKQLDKYAQAAGTPDEHVRILKAAVGVAPKATAKLLWKRIGEVLESANRLNEAAQAYRAVVELDPEDKEAKAAAEAVLARSGQHKELREGFERELAKAKTKPERRSVLTKMAEEMDREHADPSAAIAVYRQILEIDPKDLSALKRMGAASAVLERWVDVAEVAGRMASLTTDPVEAREWKARLAHLYNERLNEKAKAADLYLEILAEEPGRPDVLPALERLATAGIATSRIAATVAPVFLQQGDHNRAASWFARVLEDTADPKERIRLLLELAHLHEEKLADRRAAFEWCVKAVKEDPRNGPARRDLERIGKELASPLELAHAYVGIADATQDKTVARDLLISAATIAHEADESDFAVEALNRVLAANPEDPDALGLLHVVAMKAERWEECERVLLLRLKDKKSKKRRDLWLELADVYERMAKPDKLAEALREAKEAGADEATVIPRLSKAYELAGQTDKLVEILGREIELAEAKGDSERASRLVLKKARLVGDQLGDHASAVKQYAEVLARRPSDPDALSALEKMLQDPDQREAAARALVPACQANKDFRKLASVIEIVADSTPETSEKVALFRRAAQIHSTDLRSPERAYAALTKALALVPGDAELRIAARRAAQECGQIPAYLEAVESAAMQAEDKDQLPLLREVAELAERYLSNRDKAVGSYRAMLAIDPENLDALRGLHRLYRQAAWNEELAMVCESLAGVVYEDAEKVALLREAGALREGQLNDIEGAARCYKAIADIDALDKDAARALERLYEKLERHTELAELLALRRRQEGANPAGREIAFRQAELLRTRLGDTTAALRIYAEVLAEDPGHTGARASLEAMAASDSPGGADALRIVDPVLARTGEHLRRVNLREARLPGALYDEKAQLVAEIRKIYEEDLDQPELALVAALRAFAEGVDRAGMRPHMERLAERTESFEELADAYEEGARSAQDPDAPTYLRRAAQLRDKLGETERAVQLWRQLLEGTPNDREALDALTRLFEKGKSAKELSELYKQKASLTKDKIERSKLLISAGLAKEQLAEDTEAVDLLREAFSLDNSRTDALDALDRLFSRLKAGREHTDVLRMLAERSEDPPVRRTYLLRRAALLENLGEASEAVQGYAAVLADSPGEAQAVAGLERLFASETGRAGATAVLEPYYRSLKDARRLADVLEAKLQIGSAPNRRSTLLEIAQLREMVGQRPLAFAALIRAIREDPSDDATRNELERIAAETGSFEELAATYEDLLDQSHGGPMELEMWRRLASLYAERLVLPDKAAQAYEAIAKATPEDTAPLEALLRLYAKTNALRELADVYWRRAGLEKAPEQKKDLLFTLAQLAEEKLSDKATAIRAYHEVRKIDPEDNQSLKSLSRLYQETESWEDLAGLIAASVGIAEKRGLTEQAMDLRVKLGRLRLTKLRDPRGALNLYAEVMKLRPNHAAAVTALDEMARSEGALRAEAALALEPVFAASGDYSKMVQLLEAQIPTATAPGKADLLRKIAEIYAGPLASPEMAFVAAARAIREHPDDGMALEAAVKYVEPAQSHEELASLLAEVADRARDENARGNLYRTLARVAQTPLNETPRAIAAWRKVLEAIPSDSEALEALARIYREIGDGDALLDILKRQLSLAEDTDARVSCLFKIGEVQDERLRDYVGAIATFRRIIELTPDDELALERLDRLCARQERWPELADVIGREIALARDRGDGEQEVGLKFRLAQVREQRLLDRSGAMQLYREILESRPGHEETLARVEVIVQKEPSYDDAAEVLLAAYTATGNYAKQASLLDARINVAPDRPARKALLVELARVRSEKQERPELAFIALCRAFREDPADPELRHALERLADVSEGHEELVALYEEQFPELEDPAQAAEVALKIAQLLDTRLEQPDEALKYFERARKLDPSRSPATLPALDRLYKMKEDWTNLADVLTELAQVTNDPAEKVSYLFRLGQLCDDVLQQPDRAAEAFELILAIDPKYLPGLRALEKLYAAAKHHQRLFEVLATQRELVHGQEREQITGRMAEVAALGLQDSTRAIGLYQELLKLNPRSEAAFVALEGLYEDTSRWQDLSDLLRKKLSVIVDPREITRVNDKLGRAMARLGRADEAIAGFKAALERDPRHRRSLEALREIYELQSSWEDLATVLRRLIPLQDNAAGVKDVRLKLAEVLEKLKRRDEAVDAARRALDVEPHTANELSRAEAIFRQLEAFPEVIRTLEMRSALREAEKDVEGAVEILYEVARTYAKEMGKPELGITAYEKILELDPKSRTAFDALREHAGKVGDWRRYVASVDRFLPSVIDKEERVNLLFDAAKVQEEKLGQKDIALVMLSRAFSEDASSEEVRLAMHRLAEETGSWDELAAVYENVVDEVEKGPLAERLYTALAKIQDEHLDDHEEAEATLRKILDFDPANKAALDAMASMFARRGRDREYIIALEQRLEVAPSIEERKSILWDIAKVYDEKSKDPEEAASAYRRAMDLEPDEKTVELLANLYRRERKFTELADLLLRARDLKEDPADRGALQVQVAEVYEKELNDDEAAVEGYRQALEFDPTNRVALASLERLYTKLDRPGELLQVYDAQITVATDVKERTKILFKSAQIWEEKYQNLQNADACFESVLSFDPQNLQAVKTLVRLRRADERWEDLIRAYELQLALTNEVAEQVDLMVQLGDVWYQDLKRLDKAATLYHQALDLDPSSIPAMHALGLLYERSGNWPFALDMLSREAQARGATKESVELCHRIGKINEDMLLDRSAAKAAYLRAVEIDAGYLPSLRALKGLYQTEGDDDSYLKSAIEEAEHAEDVDQKTKAYCEVAHFYLDKREDRDNATKYFEEAAKLSPESLEVAKPLADLYVAGENWERAESMLQIVTQRLGEIAALDAKVSKELCRQYYRLGYVAEKRDRKDVALTAYERAYQLDATYLHAAEGYANLLASTEKHEKALQVYQGILIHHREELSDLEVVELYWRIGDLYRKLSSPDRAQKEFEKALAIDGSHEPSRRALVAILEDAGNYEAAIEHRQSLLDVLEGQEKVEMATAIGKICKEQLGDPYQAIDAYAVALRAVPDNPPTLEALLELYRETRQAPRAMEAIEKLVANEEVAKDVSRTKKLLFLLGEIARDEVKDDARAVDAWNRALDIDPKYVKPAFEAIENLLASRKQWKQLEENYARMIKRLPKTEDTHALRMVLWKTLGELYQRVLKDAASALQAYKVVVVGNPDDIQTVETYADLAADQPGREPEAIDAYRRALPTTANPTTVVRQLARLHAKTKSYDEAYSAAQVAAHLLGEAGADEREILEKLQPYAKRRESPQKPMTDRMWTELLYHPKVKGETGEILALLQEQIGQHYAQRPSAFGIDPRAHRIDVETSEVTAIKAYRDVLRSLNMEALELYSPYLVHALERQKGKAKPGPSPDAEVFLELCPTWPVSLKAGKRLFTEEQQASLRFFLAKNLAFSRPELVLARVMPVEQLEAVFQAAIVVGVPNYRVTADPRLVEPEVKNIERHLPDAARSALVRLARAYAKNAQAGDVRGFVEGAEYTANRTGVLIAGDVEVAKNALGKDQGGAAKLPLRSKIRDLMLFCMSAEYAKLRQALGIDVQVKVPAR